MRDEFSSRKRKHLKDRKEFRKLVKESDFEKGDLPALIIAGLTTIFPFAIVIFLLLFLIPMLIFRFF